MRFLPPGLPRDGRDGFRRQLSVSPHVMDLRPGRGRRHAANPRASVEQLRPTPCVLAFSRACDSEMGGVRQLLGQAGVRCVRVNADELASADLLLDPSRRVARVAGRWLAPTVTWIRHFSARAVGGPGRPAYRLFRQDSWRSAADQLAAVSDVAIGPGRLETLAQLRLAARQRVAVPRTILTSDLGQARDLFGCPRVVVKAADRHFVEASPGRLTGVFPMVMPRSHLGRCGRNGPPVVVQEYVEHEEELRVYYVGGLLLGFRVSKQDPADPWLGGGRVGARPVDLAPGVAEATRLLASAFGLRYGAFDFLIRGGAPVFLEVNPDGDWRWVERMSGSTAVTRAVARMLGDLHWERMRAGAVPASFDLLGFLGG